MPGGGGHYMRQSDEKLKESAKLFHDNGIQVSFLNSPMFKITLPGYRAGVSQAGNGGSAGKEAR